MAEVIDIQASFTLIEQKLKSQLKDRHSAGLSGAGKLCLASVAIGDDFSAALYCQAQQRLAASLGIEYQPLKLAQDITFECYAREIERLNQDHGINGIILNKPFPSSWPEERIFALVAERKDVEGLHPASFGKLFASGASLTTVLSGETRFIPVSPTVRSVAHLLSLTKAASVQGKIAVIVGFSSLIGKPLCLLLAGALATVVLTHIGTFQAGDLQRFIGMADIVITAAGVPGLLKREWFKAGAVVIDVGVGAKDGKLCGDVEVKSQATKAAYISPVPGGVGKLTPLFLVDNLLQLVKTTGQR